MKKNNDNLSAQVLLENENEKGAVRLEENVIISVVKMAACSVNGVNRLAGTGSIVDSIASMIGHKRSVDAISVSYDDNKLIIEIQLVVSYGINIPKLGQDVQAAVADKVKEITGLEVGKVNVIVQDIEEPISESHVKTEESQAETKE